MTDSRFGPENMQDKPGNISLYQETQEVFKNYSD